MKLSILSLLINLFVLLSLHAQPDFHRPIWQELEGKWRGNGLSSNVYVEWTSSVDGSLAFRQYQLSGADTLILMRGTCQMLQKEAELMLTVAPDTRKQRFVLEKELNHALIWKNTDAQAALQQLEWDVYGVNYAALLVNEMRSDYKFCHELERPGLLVAFQSGGFGGRPQTKTYGGAFSHWGASKGGEFSASVGLLGKQLKFGASLEFSLYRYAYDYAQKNDFSSPLKGRATVGGLRIALVPQVYFGKRDWLGLHAGVYMDALGYRRFVPDAGTVLTENRLNSNSSNRRGGFLGLNLSVPWRFEVKPYVWARAYGTHHAAFGIGVRR